MLLDTNGKKYDHRKKCAYEKHKEKRREKPLSYCHSDRGRNYYLLRAYGITLDQYNKMLLNQNHSCKICGGTNLNGRPLGVGHNHETGKVRALLCSKCNSALGHINEDRSIALQIIKYLDTY